MEILENINLGKLTTFRAGGDVSYLINARNSDEISEAINFAKSKDLPYFFFGRGSNCLILDGLFQAVCIRLVKMNEISISGNVIKTQCGVDLHKVSRLAYDNSLTGFEALAGIPGTVGGSVLMNAGAYGTEICDVLLSSTYMNQDGEIVKISNQEHNFSYRQSIYRENPSFVLLEAEFELKPGSQEDIMAKIRKHRDSRISKQPLEFGSAGSTFKRPGPEVYVGTMIEELNLKGHMIGGAQVSEKHAGFVINKNKATATDILNLIDYIKDIVKTNRGYDLECEMIVIGE